MPPVDACVVVGIISDTHGLLRPEAVDALAGCQQILHAGDVGKVDVIERLCRLAPTDAIRGNVDRGGWADALSKTLTVSVRQLRIHVLHDLQTLAVDPLQGNVDLIVSGHSHRPAIRETAGVIYLNPGSAGARRFSLPVTLARLTIDPSGVRVDLIDVLANVILQTLIRAPRQAST